MTPRRFQISNHKKVDLGLTYMKIYHFKARYRAANEQLSAYYVDKNKAELIQSVTKVMPIASLLLQINLIQQEDLEKIEAAGTRQDQMAQLYQILDKGGKKVKSAFYTILEEQEPDVIKLGKHLYFFLLHHLKWKHTE
ncbi:hypothetical protein UPYG_G00243570 [Umbra pygmaea]|uniref:CARD domain-containing protein n=1 Tax=Umbra pygmaea TaxID=75934 RepID=A0ABD0WFU1_UMBPY